MGGRASSEAAENEPVFANETTGVNLIPFASMSAWLGPLLIFWLSVWGPLRPFHYPAGDLLPPLPLCVAVLAGGIALWWMPASYYRIRSFERSGRLYEALGVRLFRWFVPDGDGANQWRRRREPTFRIIRNRRHALAFVRRTELGEKSHLVLLVLGGASSAFAWAIGWAGWALFLGIGNVLVNLYPVLLQRYTRARLLSIVTSHQKRVAMH